MERMSNKKITVYRLLEKSVVFPIVPLSAKRKWMNKTKEKFAYKCLPLTIANQYGYAVLSPADFTVDWWGGSSVGDVDFKVTSDDENIVNYFHHYFGDGTFTIHLDFIIKTPAGFSTYIRGIPNETKGGIKALDAIVETDWLPFTFTYNFLITEPGTYTFKKDEPLFIFFPIERNTVENFSIEESWIENDEAFFKDFEDYEKERTIAIDTMPNDKRAKFQFFYRDGVKASGEKVSIKNHITNLIFGGKRGNIK
jgi:hypothetical protein